MLKNSLDLADLSLWSNSAGGGGDDTIRDRSEEDTILHSMKKRTLKDYDKVLN